MVLVQHLKLIKDIRDFFVDYAVKLNNLLINSTEREPLVLHALESVDLLDRKKHFPSELSGGQQQRVAIARTLAGDPPIILADEPTGELDPKTSVEMLELSKKLNEQGRTIILITHDILIAKRIIRFRDGRLYADA
ncbi:ABC transporter [Paenibacillus sp. yr247]|uniref:ATP-binding cassette domain-containing protein n=1 Tax=Paenibacillus sp. yr247 TaxID=1761880 RepID=UPI00088AAAAE|nr:ATP-binding cassette domain-containing protein [Paenibacillus sp. yr247]SDN95389.1 ABC transporter [Paenibacillus sp. yr247]